MSIRVVLSAVAGLSLLACATTSTQPIAATTPVKVVITTAPSIDKVINVKKTTAQTELWLRKLAPDAAPVTVAMHFTGTTLVQRGYFARGAETHGNPEPVTYISTVPSLSPTPWAEPPVITGTWTVPAGPSLTVGNQVAVEGTYTISDANGVTLDEGPILTDPGDDQRELAWRMANRVKELSRKSS